MAWFVSTTQRNTRQVGYSKCEAHDPENEDRKKKGLPKEPLIIQRSDNEPCYLSICWYSLASLVIRLTAMMAIQAKRKPGMIS